jgi:hypothetical protein
LPEIHALFPDGALFIYLFIFQHITHPCLSPTLVYFEVNSLLGTVNVDPVFVGLRVLGKILGPEREEVTVDWRK